MATECTSSCSKVCSKLLQLVQAVLLTGFLEEEAERFRTAMIEMDGDMIKVKLLSGRVSSRRLQSDEQASWHRT